MHYMTNICEINKFGIPALNGIDHPLEEMSVYIVISVLFSRAMVT